MFQFSGKTGDVYLHCKLKLCLKENNSCAPVRSQKKTYTETNTCKLLFILQVLDQHISFKICQAGAVLSLTNTISVALL